MSPNSTRDSEKKPLTARTAKTNSVADTSMYEYQSHILGTKKCQMPNPIDAALPSVIRTLVSNVSKPSPPACEARTNYS